jgi:phosphohistidine phosphatase SixA
MPVIVIMRHAEAEPMRPDFGTQMNRPLTARGRVQADGTAWRIACSFGHALTGDTIPGAETSKSGRTGIRAARDLIPTESGQGSESGESTSGATPLPSVEGDPFHTAILSLESLRMAAVGDEFALPMLDGGQFSFAAGGSEEPATASQRRAALENASVPKALPMVIWSSPALRCLETAKPLADLVGSVPRPVPALYEDREFDLMTDVIAGLPRDCQRLVLVTHLPQVETVLVRLGLARLGPVTPAMAVRLLFDNAGRLVAHRKI